MTQQVINRGKCNSIGGACIRYYCECHDTAPSDWELVFKRKFTNDGSVLVRQKKPTPWMLTIPAQQVINFIRSVEHAAILRTRERVVREALEKMPREINLGAPILGLGSFSFGQGYNKALAEFRTLLSSLNQESHE